MVVNKKATNQHTSSQKQKPDISILEASVESLSKNLIKLENEVNDQRKENKNIIIAVVVALIFIVVTVAIEVILFHTRENKEFVNLYNQYTQNIQKVEQDISQIKLDSQKALFDLKEELQINISKAKKDSLIQNN